MPDTPPPDQPVDIVWTIHHTSGPGCEKRMHWGTGAQAASYVANPVLPMAPGWRYEPCIHLGAQR